MSVRGTSSAFAIALFLAVPAEAQVLRPKLISGPPPGAAKILGGNQYAFEIKCSPRGALSDPSDLFNNRNRSLFLLVAPKAPASTDTLPNDVLTAVQVYSIGRNKDTNQQVIVDDRNCSKSFLVNGSKDVAIVVTDNWLNNFSDSDFGKVLSGAFALVSPLFALFAGQPVPALLSSRLDNIATVRAKAADILTVLNKGQNITRPVRDLRVGTYRIQSDYAVVSITIRPVASIVLDRNRAFVEDLKAQINSASVKLDSAKLEASCRAGRYGIYQLRFRSPTDLAFGLAHLSAHAGFSIDETIKCLTPEYALVAAKAGNPFWSNFPDDFKFNPERLAPKPGDQPRFDTVEKDLYDLVVALARYSRNDPPPAISVSTLERLLAPQVAILDNTTSLAVTDDVAPLERFDAVKKFKTKGYIRFGCYAATDATTQASDKATAIIVVFNAPNAATRASLDSALAVRPQFTDDGKQVKSLAVSDNRAWISAALKKNDYECIGISVERPAAPPR
jgi:hypothetical protein